MKRKVRLLVINGPNLNLLGVREPTIYGSQNYAALVRFLKKRAAEKGVRISVFQSNSEGDIVTRIHKAYRKTDAIIINPAAYTHTSVALLDALKAVAIPAAEVHLSKVSEREDFRQVSYVRAACEKTFSGDGFESYGKAIDYFAEKFL